MTRQALLAVVVALLAVTGGCAGLGDGGDAADAEAVGDVGDQSSAFDGGDGGGERELADADGGESDGGSTLASVEPSAERTIVRTATLEVGVDSYEDGRAALTAEADAVGGYLADAEERTRDREVGNATESWTVGTLTYRVPSESFDDFYAAVTATGNVTEATTEAEDVGDRLLDLEARIETHETQRDRLRDLYAEANETEDVLAIDDRLQAVQERLERLEATRASLADDVAYSTVTVTLAEPEPTPDPKAERETAPAWYETSVASAFLESVAGVGTVARAAVVVGAYAAPYLLAFGVPVVALAAVVRRLR